MADTPKNKHAQALSKLGASKGGYARAKALSKAELSEIGKNAVKVRWQKYRLAQAQKPGFSEDL